MLSKRLVFIEMQHIKTACYSKTNRELLLVIDDSAKHLTCSTT